MKSLVTLNLDRSSSPVLDAWGDGLNCLGAWLLLPKKFFCVDPPQPSSPMILEPWSLLASSCPF